MFSRSIWTGKHCMLDRQRKKTRMGDITTNKHRSIYPYLQYFRREPGCGEVPF
jgi:hypothetical protein